MRNALIGIVVVAIVAIFGITQATYVVTETDQVIITQFGRPVGGAITDPGLHFRVPFIQDVNRFEKRFLEWDGERNQVPTSDKRFIFVDTYARWRISDPLKFFERLGDEAGAQRRLDDILDGETRNVIARHNLIEVVRSTDRDFAVDDEDSGGLSAGIRPGESGDNPLEARDFEVDVGRKKLAQMVLEDSQKRTADLGVEILDFQFKRINYVRAVQDEVFQRMISERKRIAEQFRSEGKGEAARINGEKERELKRITSEAEKQAKLIRGEADAKAADVYAESYNANPRFYRFMKSMETLKETVDAETVLLLGTDAEMLQYLEDASP